MCRKMMIVCLSLVVAFGVIQPASAELVGHWKLDEGTGPIAADSSDYGNDGDLMGDPEWVVGKIARALRFDGDGDYVEVPHADILTVDTEVSVAAWINADSLAPAGQGYSGIVAKGNGPRSYSLYTTSGGPLHFSTGGTGTNSGASVPLNEWVHVVASVVGGQHEYYINGELTNRTGSGITLPGGSDSANVLIGMTHEGANRLFQGMIDDVRVYNQALTLDELPDVMKGELPTLAADPVPEDEATDVLRDGILTWKAGESAQTHNVYLGTVWEDVNAASANALVSEGQSANTHNPGRLDFGQTYYWRVDEVNSAPDFTVFAGEVWSFTVEPFSYPIENITATATSSNAADMGPEKTIDGSGLNELDQHGMDAPTMWLSGVGDPTPSIQYEFDRVYKLDALLVWNSNQIIESFLGIGAKDVVIETSIDGVEWTVLEGATRFNQAPGAPTYTANTRIDFAGVLAQSVRITISAGYGMMPQYGLSEVRFLYIPTFAREPQPADGSTTDNANIVLSWRSGREAASHRIYLGTDPGDLTLARTTSEPTFAPGDLNYDTTYFWSVTEVNDAEAVTSYASDVWRFTIPDSVPVDNFDQYDDDCNRIFFAWEDGLGHNGGEDIDDCDVPPSNGNGSGSILGNATAPFAERTIVHSGRQSAPFDYDNSATDNSEITVNVADLQVGQDWAGHGIKALTLRFLGDPDNAVQQMYVKINGSKVPYDGDAENLRVSSWQMWYVDLSLLNVSNVTTLGIGLERIGGVGGQGMLYLDDIRLHSRDRQLITPTDPGAAGLVAHWKLDEASGLTVADSSGSGNNGALIGMTGTEWTAGILDGALMLNGSDQYVDFGNPTSLQLTGEVTISAWVKMEADNDAYMGIAGKMGGSTGANRGFVLVKHTDDVFRLWFVTDGNFSGADSDVTYFDTNWHHLVGVISGDTGSLYVDGVKQAIEAQGELQDSGDYAFIGRQYDDDSNSGRFWNGTIDDVRIYDRALTAGEAAGLAGQTEPFDKPF